MILVGAFSERPTGRGVTAVRFILSGVALPGMTALLLFGSAGRIDLPLFWAFVATHSSVMLGWGLLVLLRWPDLAEERLNPGPGADPRDKRWLKVYLVLGFVVFIVAGLDVGRLHWSAMLPLWVQVAALVSIVPALGIGGWAIAVNRFFSSVVRIQKDRGHVVVDRGPYALVRHPGYVSGMIVWPCYALALGSLVALVPVFLVEVMLVLRTAREDRTLRRELEGYEEYCQRTRYRLLPGVW